MPPFRGEGGCQAIEDALKLARAIESMDKSDIGSIKSIMSSYQSEMLERGGRAARASASVLDGEIDPAERVVGGESIRELPKEKVVL